MRARTSRDKTRPVTPQLRVGFVLSKRFTLSAFSLFVDHLRLAADEGDRSRQHLCRWQLIATESYVESSSGIAVKTDGVLPDPGGFDYIVVVGGTLHGGAQVDDVTATYLRDAAKRVPLIGLCTGSFVLARLGLLAGRRCCVSWYHVNDFMDEFPSMPAPVSDRLFLVDGDVITCSGGAGAADLASYLIGKHLGAARVQRSRNILLLDRARSALDAQPVDGFWSDIKDPRVRRAILMMKQDLRSPLKIDRIAQAIQVSARQLERLFKTELGDTPLNVYRTIRLRQARWDLENTNRTATDIALDNGFCDVAALSTQIAAAYGLPPSRLRRNAKTQFRDNDIDREAAS